MYQLFEVFGIELEYMIVDSSSLSIKPIADKILIDSEGKISSDILRGPITWSNELAAHVIELKTTDPVQTLEKLDLEFLKSITEINSLLAEQQAILLSSACHPFMNPKEECHLWQHEWSEIYNLYNKLFDCRAHGWVNLQSIHLNLPFKGDQEFAKLHSAIRVILPLLPALAASSPVLEGQNLQIKDMRLHYYLNHQTRVKSTMGEVIPDAIQTEAEYKKMIWEPIERDIEKLGCKGVLNPVVFNARGAIARFDRGSIEIRLLDIQESPVADLAILSLIIEVLKDLVAEKHSTSKQQSAISTQSLRQLLDQTLIQAEQTSLPDKDLVNLFGIDRKLQTINDFWQELYQRHSAKFSKEYQKALNHILTNGTLATRISNKLGENFDHNTLKNEYLALSDCLAQNKLYA
ncbi:MAG: glutamate-cysteine ligase family protein [Bdellovibrionota bacterium]